MRISAIQVKKDALITLYQFVNKPDFIIPEEDVPDFVFAVADVLCKIYDIYKDCGCTDENNKISFSLAYNGIASGITVRKEDGKILFIPSTTRNTGEQEFYRYEEIAKYRKEIVQFIKDCIDKVYEKINKKASEAYGTAAELIDPRDFEILLQDATKGGEE